MSMSQPMQVFTSKASKDDPTKDEAGTPEAILTLGRLVLGRYDLDPASSEVFNRTVRAAVYYTREDDGLRPQQPWGRRDTPLRLWLNPPFLQTEAFLLRLIAEIEAGTVEGALVLVNSNVGYQWYERAVDRWPAVQLRQRLTFLKADGTPHRGEHKKGQTIMLAGCPQLRPAFYGLFGRYGRIVPTAAAQQALLGLIGAFDGIERS